MSQKLSVDGFKRFVSVSSKLHKNHDENSDGRYFLEVDVEYPKNLFNSHKDLPYLAEKKKIGKCENLICNIQAKNNMLFT